MPTILQLRRGSDSQNNGFIGAAGELTFDTSNNTIRAHDGTTQGGHRLATINDLASVGVDSSQVTSIVDSAYVQARQVDFFRDSSFVTGIVDEVYIQARDRVRDSSFITDIVDSAFIQSKQAFSPYGDSDVTLLVDSAYVQARQTDFFRDSSFVTGIVDEVYIQARDRVRDSSFIIDLTSDYYISSVNNDTKANNLTFDDDAILKFGTSGNIELLYNSSTSAAQIKMATGEELQIRADTLNLQSRTGETYLNAVANGGIQLRYDNQARLKVEDQGITVVGNILPQFGGFYDIGSAAKRWGTVYTDDLDVGPSSIYMGSLKMSADSSGGLVLETVDSNGTVLEQQGTIDPKNLDNAINLELDSNGQQPIDEFNKTSHRTARYIIQMEANNSFHSTEILLMHNNTEVFMTEYAVLRTDSALGDITADMDGDNVRLLITPSYNTTIIKAKRLIIDA